MSSPSPGSASRPRRGAPDPWAARLAERDLGFVEPLLGPLRTALRRYFDVHIEGWEHVPRGASLLVGNHSGGVPPYESIVFAVEYLHRFGVDAPLYWLAHSALMAVPVLGPFLRGCGVLPASHSAALAVLEREASLVVYPGGELELHRPWTARDEIRFQGRTGFLRLAAESGAPLVPVVASGGHATYLPLSDGRRLARMLRLDRLLRLRTLPLSFSVPWGLNLGYLPHVPFPSTIRIRILPAVDVAEQFGDDLDTAYELVTAQMQATLSELVTRRRPVR